MSDTATMSSREFRLPVLGAGSAGAAIIQWHVAPGDYIVAHQPLLTVETDTAVIDIPAPHSGRITSLAAREGERIPVGTVLATFAPPPGTDHAPEHPQDTSLPASHGRNAPGVTERGRQASPATRQLARELRSALESIATSGAPAGSSQERAPGLALDGAWRELDETRRALAMRMAATHAVPATTLHARARIGAWFRKARPTLRLVRALLHACRVEPALNGGFDATRPARRLHATVCVRLLAGNRDAPFIATLPDAARCTDAELLALLLQPHTAQHGSTPQAPDAATITLWNFGATGAETAQMRVEPPQVACIGAGRISEAVIARDGIVVIEPLLPLSLSFDARAVSGSEAMRFLDALRTHLERADAA